MKYIVAGSVIVNSVVYYDGRKIPNILGGAGLYAFTGVRLYDDDSMLVAPVGADFYDYYGEWCRENNLVTDGFKVVDPHTMNSVLTYRDAYGNYTDQSIYPLEEGGFGPVHTPRLRQEPGDVEPFVGPETRGVSLFGSELLVALSKRKDRAFKIMWELPAKNDYQEFLDLVQYADIYSLNRPESFYLFSTDSDEATIEKLRQVDRPCYYRIGQEGAYMVTRNDVFFIPMVNVVDFKDEKDQTGCGNSSTAAAAWAFFEGYDPLMACIIGNVMAGYNAMQYGPVPVMDAKTRQAALGRAKQIYDQYRSDHGITGEIRW